MGLLEKAIDVYKEKQKFDNERNESIAEEFAKEALERLNEILIGKDKSFYYSGEIEIIEKCPGSTTFRVDGILFVVNYSQRIYDISVRQTCPKCKTEYNTT